MKGDEEQEEKSRDLPKHLTFKAQITQAKTEEIPWKLKGDARGRGSQRRTTAPPHSEEKSLRRGSTNLAPSPTHGPSGSKTEKSEEAKRQGHRLLQLSLPRLRSREERYAPRLPFILVKIEIQKREDKEAVTAGGKDGGSGYGELNTRRLDGRPTTVDAVVGLFVRKN
ncbi:hypothetical protein Bca52824_015574 [Brassica carinata]|uniref:Uncharacterized protein n=1 Tax=Brassica carinata TaxID=52824 RepID=A0A8X7W3F5_BRACI|nr:hypothetical protein Bca52824_015574 [Brassica carinata]